MVMTGATTGSSANSRGSLTATVIDLSYAVVLTCCGLIGFRTVFGGAEWWIASAVGVLAGSALAWVGLRVRLDALVLGAGTVAAYFLLSGFGDPDHAVLTVFPSTQTMQAAARTSVFGWTDLLGVAPPIGRSYALLGIPLLCGLVGVVAAGSLAMRTRSAVLPVLAPAAVLVVTILFGTSRPAAALVQGGFFFVAVLVGTAWRRRSGAAAVRSRHSSRIVVGAGIVLAALVAGGVGGGVLPGFSGTPRYVLRDHVDPPFDPWVYPSPLVEYRSFRKVPEQCGRSGDVLFTDVKGVDPATPLRIAVLDEYDGVSWRVASALKHSDSVSGVFDRIGTRIAPASTGSLRTLRYTVACGDAVRQQVWLPSIGAVQAFRFFGPRADALRNGLRVNRVTNTALTTAYLQAGDVIEVDVVSGPAPRPESDIARATPAAVNPGPLDLDGSVKQRQQISALPGKLKITADPQHPLATFVRVAEVMRTNDTLRPAVFGYSDGDKRSERSLSGHGINRLYELACAVDPRCATTPAYGNDEQYAALLALVGRELGLATRVVVGVCPTPQKPAGERNGSAAVCDGSAAVSSVSAASVTAWVEVATQQFGWQPVVATNRTKNKPNVRPQTNGASDAGQIPPGLPESGSSQRASRPEGGDRTKPASPEQDGFRWVLVVWVVLPLVLVALPLLAIVLGKRRRVRRRRAAPDPRVQCLGAWQEVTDLAHDLGRPVPVSTTRREAARILDRPAVTAIAEATDAAVFGRGVPTPVEVEAQWSRSQLALEELLADVGTWRRARVAANPASLLRNTDRRRTATLERQRATGAAQPGDSR